MEDTADWIHLHDGFVRMLSDRRWDPDLQEDGDETSSTVKSQNTEIQMLKLSRKQGSA